jgi:hypothetical protein
MSRFNGGRWNRILVWTGAALAWGTAFIAIWLEPERGVDAAQPAAGKSAESSAQAIMPRPGPQGLVILRFAPVDTPASEVVSVRVETAASPGFSPALQAAAPSQPAPAPESSGS